MDSIGGYKENLRRSFIESTKAGHYYSPQKGSGIGEFLKSTKAKKYEFAEKPNYVNPFNTFGINSEHLDKEKVSSPLKKESIQRRRTDNYGTFSETADNLNASLTP
jgi:hypothetical protein